MSAMCLGVPSTTIYSSTRQETKKNVLMLQIHSNDICLYDSQFINGTRTTSSPRKEMEIYIRIAVLVSFYSFTIAFVNILSLILKERGSNQMGCISFKAVGTLTGEQNQSKDVRVCPIVLDQKIDCAPQCKTETKTKRDDMVSKQKQKPTKDIKYNSEGEKSDAKDIRPVGLKNANSVCYMNAMMQALSSSRKLIEQLEFLNGSINKNYKLSSFLDILNALNDKNAIRSDTQDVSDQLARFVDDVNWNRPSQQDAFQLLSFFINAIHKEIGTKHTMFPKFQLLHSFSENSGYNKLQDHLAFALPLTDNYNDKTGVDIKRLFDVFFAASSIDDGTYTTSMNIFKEPPEVFLVHIQANEWSEAQGEYIKPEYFINYSEYLEYEFSVAKDITEIQETYVKMSATYQLMAVVRHVGTVKDGHYTTYRKCGNDWYRANDEHVTKVDFHFKIIPYIMVYERSEK